MKKLTKLEKLQSFITKYNISYVYISVNKSMVTKAIFIGIFIALLPIPMQMLVVLVLMKFFTFNVPLAILLCWITNPITMPFIYYAEYIIGSYVLNTDIVTIEMSIEWFHTNFMDIFFQIYIGALLLATLLASIAYFLVNYLWIYFVYKNKKLHHSERKNK